MFIIFILLIDGSLYQVEERLFCVDLLESITYLVCHDNDISQDDLAKIFRSRGVASKLCQALGSGKNRCCVDEFMAFIFQTTKLKRKEAFSPEKLKEIFVAHFGDEKKEINFDEFKKIIPGKDEFFVKRLFELFDCDKSGYISVEEFSETLQDFSSEDDDSKVALLFHIYDVNDDGKLFKENFIKVIEACMMESAIKLDQEHRVL